MNGRFRRIPVLVNRVIAGSMPGVKAVAINAEGLELVGPRGFSVSWADTAWGIEPDGRISWGKQRSGPGVTPRPADLATGDLAEAGSTEDQSAGAAYPAIGLRQARGAGPCR